MSNYGSLEQKIHKFMCNTFRDIIRYFSAVASEDPEYAEFDEGNKYNFSNEQEWAKYICLLYKVDEQLRLRLLFIEA